MPKLAILDVSENSLHCDADFKALMTWVVKQRIAHGPVEKSHAALKTPLTSLNAKWIDPKNVQKSWQSLAFTVCTSDKKENVAQETADEDEGEDEIAEDSDTDEDYDNYFEEVASEISKEDHNIHRVDNELVDGGLTVTEVEKKGIRRILPSHPIIDENEFEEIFDELEKKEVSQAEFMRTWGTIVIFTLCCLILMIIIVRLAAMLLDKRHERYRQAILASKNSFVYQKLSEEIGGGHPGKTPSIPKVHRYQPIQQV